MRAIAEATFAELLEVLEVSQGSNAALPDRFRAGLRAYIDFGLSRPDAYRVTFLSPASRAQPNPCDTIQAADHSFAILQRGVEDMMAAGLFRPGPSQPAGEAIWACLHGVTSMLLDQAEHIKTPHEHLIQQVIGMTVAGLE